MVAIGRNEALVESHAAVFALQVEDFAMEAFDVGFQVPRKLEHLAADIALAMFRFVKPFTFQFLPHFDKPFTSLFSHNEVFIS